jgi:hypothetical protein
MDIFQELQKAELLIEQYEDTNEPESKMELKQTISSILKDVRANLSTLTDEEDLQEATEQLEEFEEILTY